MGVNSSINSSTGEGEHFTAIINPPKKSPSSSTHSRKSHIKINPRARILKDISFELLWENFLNSTASSFALTQSDVTGLLIESYRVDENEKVKVDQAKKTEDVKAYITLLEELMQKTGIKTFDFMAICSSVLLLSDLSIETKVDQLFEWVVLNPESVEFSFEEFLVALASFECGLSHALGHSACSEAYVKGLAMQWLALADPRHKGSADAHTRISSQHFFDFCTNRQHIVRRLLETLATAEAEVDGNRIQEVSDTLDLLSEPAGGDEWLANPAWKKTAERMLPVGLQKNPPNEKPLSSLSLEWVHGYRGFDSRNNIGYADAAGTQILFTAAALGIVQDSGALGSGEGRWQQYFGEHGDDIISMTSIRVNGQTLIASGEIGKTPAIYVYAWKPGEKTGEFTSLTCVRGYHTKGVSQLAFSADGKTLFSVGVDYTVALYDTEQGSKNFGKMIASSQGPKGRVLGVCSYSTTGDRCFVSCGEKHAVAWKLKKGSLVQEQCKLGGHRNKMFLSAVRGAGETALMGTSEGDLLVLSDVTVLAAVTLKSPLGSGHGKNAINAMWTDPTGELLATGDREGRVLVWRVSVTIAKDGAKSTKTCNLSMLHEFCVVGHALTESVDGITGGDAQPPGSPKKPRRPPQEAGKKRPASAKDSKSKPMKEQTQSAAALTQEKTPPIRALSLSDDAGRLLVGTQTCELLEFRLTGDNRFNEAAQGPHQAQDGTYPSLGARALVSGHFKDEVWGLAVRPITAENCGSGVEYCTVGDDGFLRLWSLEAHQQICCVQLPGMARTCDYSPDGNYLAVGLGGRAGKGGKTPVDGMVKIFRLDRVEQDQRLKAPSITQVAEIKEAKQWISVVRFSPDGGTLAVGSRDNNVYFYSVAKQFKRKAKFSKHGSGINQLDFSRDSKYLQSCCSAYEILFSDASTGAQVTDGASKLKDEQWGSWTCTLGWPVIGIWSGSLDGSDINAVARSPSGELLATSDDFGKVNVFKYPAVKDGGSAHCDYLGHSSHVTCVRWASCAPEAGGSGGVFHTPATDDYLLSVGGEDKCIFQWRNSGGDSGAGTKQTSEAAEEQMDDLFMEGPSGGDEFMAVKPWLGAIVAPSAWAKPDPAKAAPFVAALGELGIHHQRLLEEGCKFSAQVGGKVQVPSVYSDVAEAAENALDKMYQSGMDNSTPPDTDELELEWVHGYRGFDCRNNVFYVEPSQRSAGNKVVSRGVLYFAAALGVYLNPAEKRQKYFKGHSDDLISMAVFPLAQASTDGAPLPAQGDAVVATGQQGKGGTFVWEVPSMRTLAVLQTKQKNVNQLAFSSDGRRLISVAEDKDVAVSDWTTQTVLCVTKGEPAMTLHVAADSLVSSSLRFLSCGDKHMRLWTLNGRNLTASKVVTSSCSGCSVQTYVSCVSVHGKYLVGCEDGSIYTVPAEGKGVKARFDHHSAETKKTLGKKGAAITALSVLTGSGECLLLSGGKNGSVVVWDAGSLKDKDKPVKRFSFEIGDVGMSDIMAKQIQSMNVFPNLQKSPLLGEEDLLLVVATRGCDLLEVRCSLDKGQASLYKSESTSDGVLMRAHCNDELWGVAPHPSRPEYCSVGDDKTMRFFSIHNRKMIQVVPLGLISRTVEYNPSGSLLALGFGGSLGRGKETGGGAVRLYSGDPYAEGGVRKLDERKDAKQWVSDVKFSADGSTLVVGAHDCKIYIYDVKEGVDGSKVSAKLSLRNKFSKHNSVINHLDLSADGRFMQSTCSAYELLFCDLGSGKQITSATELRDVKWKTWTCTLGWPVQGIWPPGADGSDINAVHRSHSGHLVATSDDFGKVNLFRYPAVQTGAGVNAYSAHSSHVMCVRWTAGDECLISCGGNDKCLMQWRHHMTDVGSAGSSGTSADTGDEDSPTIDSAGDPEGHGEAEGEAPGGEIFDLLDGPGGGDESGAVKPWVGAVRAPKNPPPVSDKPPAAQLSLEWVHGYTSASAGASNSRISDNLFYNSNGDPVYPAAALAVLLSRDESSRDAAEGTDKDLSHLSQTFFTGHDDDVLCLTISRDRRFLATGQTASKTSKGKGSVILWDAVQGRLLSRMDGCHQRAVTSLAFNPQGDLLLSVGQDDTNTHILWSDVGGGWSRVQQLASCKGDRSPVLFSRWVHNSSPMSVKNEYHFVTGGADGINFWKLEGSSLSKKPGRFGNKYKKAPLLCAANLQGKGSWKVVVGTAGGDLYSFDEREVSTAVEKGHKGSVYSVAEGGAECLFLVSGGKDQHVRVWNQALQPISAFDISPYALVNGTIASLDLKPEDPASGGQLVLLAGTHGGEIIEICSERAEGKKATSSAADGEHRNLDLSRARAQVLLHSHYSGELWGLAPHPLDADLLATVGDDGTLRIWSIKRKTMLASVELHWPARCVSWHPLGNVLAVGFHESVKGGYSKGGKKGKKKAVSKEDGDSGDKVHKGAIHLYSFRYTPSTGAVELVKRADGCSSVAWIGDLKFSPDGLMLGAGSHDKRLYAYALPEISSGDVGNAADWEAWTSCLAKPKFEFNKHSSAVIHFDFSLDGKYWQSNCQAAELLFGHTATGKQETSASKLADYNGQLEDSPESEGRLWASQTCTLGWPVQGIWPPGSDTTDVNAVDRHVNQQLLATADDFGSVKLFRYPCVKQGSQFKEYAGHSSHVTSVRWSAGEHLLSVGGNDKCLFVWRLDEK